MITYPKIAAIILNTNRRDDTLACLSSLMANQYPDLEVIVLDNASTDGSVAAIHDQYPSVNIHALEENKGYAGNNNTGIQKALASAADWVFILNEDIILAKDALAQMMRAVVDRNDVGIIGPLVYHFDEPQIIQTAGGMLNQQWDSQHRAQNEADEHLFSSPLETDWVSGCAIGVRREAIEKAGMIDDRFFYYWEETEWCLRIRSYGWKALIIPQAKIWHKGVQREYQPNPNVTYYATRNRLLLYKKHHPPFKVWLSTSLFFLRTLVSWSIKPKWRTMRNHRDAMWQGLMDFMMARWGKRAEKPTYDYKA